MRLTLAQKKFLSLSIALIVLVQAGRATLLFAAPPKRGKAMQERRPSSPPPVESTVGEPDYQFPLDVITDEEALWNEFAPQATTPPVEGTRCNVSASRTAEPTWQESGPYYAKWKFPIQVKCSPAQGSQLYQCEELVIRTVAYVRNPSNNTWVGLLNDPTTPSVPSLYCNSVYNTDVYTHSTIAVVAANGYATGTYRNYVYLFRKSDADAAIWTSPVLTTYKEWPYTSPY